MCQCSVEVLDIDTCWILDTLSMKSVGAMEIVYCHHLKPLKFKNNQHIEFYCFLTKRKRQKIEINKMKQKHMKTLTSFMLNRIYHQSSTKYTAKSSKEHFQNPNEATSVPSLYKPHQVLQPDPPEPGSHQPS